MLDKFRYAINNPQSFLLKQAYKCFKPFGHNNYKRFIILARARTGSNLLISYLRSHPQVHAEALEIFSKLNGRNHTKILSDTFSKQPFYVKAAGFKMMYNHPLDNRDCGIWDDLENMNDLYVIHLKRRNILRSLVSLRIAKNQGIWLNTGKVKKEQDKKKIYFEKDELEKLFLQTKGWQNNGAHIFRNHPLLEIYYEDLTSDTNKEFNRITNFLEVNHVRPKTVLKRQNPEKLSTLIGNYGQLKNEFMGTEWSSYFED